LGNFNGIDISNVARSVEGSRVRFVMLFSSPPPQDAPSMSGNRNALDAV
jgi:hypothetical protein